MQVFVTDTDGRALDLGRKVRHATKKQRRVCKPDMTATVATSAAPNGAV